MPLAADVVAVRVFLTAPQDVFHLIFQMKLLLFQGDFFEVFGL